MSAYNGPFGALTQDAANALLSAGTSALASLFRNVYYLDPANGYDGNTGLSQGQAFKTLATAYGACTAGQNDAVVLMANGGTSATARSDASFTWAKSASDRERSAGVVLPARTHCPEYEHGGLHAVFHGVCVRLHLPEHSVVHGLYGRHDGAGRDGRHGQPELLPELPDCRDV
jgi:hypothetical protein